MKTRSMLLAMVLGAVLLSAGSAQAAQGVVLGPSDLPVATQSQLRAEVAKAQKAHPELFTRVAQARELASSMDARKRGRHATVTPFLRALGPEALMPMLNALALDGPARAGLSDSAWQTLRVGLLEAVGSLRSSKATPVLIAILDSGESDEAVVRATAEALGRIADEPALRKLTSLAERPGPKQKAVIAGMGDCRRKAAAQSLARLLDQRPSSDLARVLVHSLGDIGNAWAWKTSAVAQSGEEKETRAIAASALVKAFLAYPSEVRGAAAKALLVVDDPSTVALLEAGKAGASDELKADIERLKQRLASNPTR